MPLLPIAECGEVVGPPPGCAELFDVAESILEAAWVALAPFIPADDSPCYPGVSTYVSLGRPPADMHDLLAVWLVQLGPTGRSTTAATRGAPFAAVEAIWQIDLWEDAYPTATSNGDQFIVPSPDLLHEVNRYLYAHAHAIYTGVLANLTELPCQTAVPGVLTPLEPQGGSAGWTFRVTTSMF
jgi:hypothetical protein